MTYIISEAARLLNVSKQSLALWEKRGLIPKPQRRPTGRREYTDADIKAIREFLSQKKQTK